MKKAITAVLIMFIVLPLAARDGNRSTVMLDLSPVNCTPGEAGRINGALRKSVEAIRHCTLKPARKVAAIIEKNGIISPCPDARCAARVAKLAGAERAIYGTVRRAVIKYDRRVGDEGAGKYLLQEKEAERFIVTLHIVDAKGGTVIGSVTDAPERAAARLQPFFTPPKGVDDRAAADGGPGLSIHAAPSFFIPVGSFRSMAQAALGLNFGISVIHPAMKGFRLMAQGGYHYLFSDRKEIEAFHSFTLALFAGYDFHLPKNFSVTPMAGGGYIIHLLSQDISRVRVPGVYSYSKRVYADPHLTARFEAAWRINERFSIFAAPFFTAFFEKSSTGLYPGFDAGFRCAF